MILGGCILRIIMLNYNKHGKGFRNPNRQDNYSR